MPDVRALAGAYGVRVELADLGDWGSAALLAEYDPEGAVIRINERELPAILRRAQHDGADARADAVGRAIAHELYHHREAVGEIPRLTDRRAREAAADAFADALLSAP